MTGIGIGTTAIIQEATRLKLLLHRLDRRYRSALQALAVAEMVLAWSAFYSLASGDYLLLGGMLVTAVAGLALVKIWNQGDGQETVQDRVHGFEDE